MLTNFNGVYLGDQRLDPVFDGTNCRGARALYHFVTADMLAAERARDGVR